MGDGCAVCAAVDLNMSPLEGSAPVTSTVVGSDHDFKLREKGLGGEQRLQKPGG